MAEHCEDCKSQVLCPGVYATTRLDALRKLRREGYAVVEAESWRLRSDFGVVPAAEPVPVNVFEGKPKWVTPTDVPLVDPSPAASAPKEATDG